MMFGKPHLCYMYLCYMFFPYAILASIHRCEKCTLEYTGRHPPKNARRFRFTDPHLTPWLTEIPYMRNTLGEGYAWFSKPALFPEDADLLSLGYMGGQQFPLTGIRQKPDNCIKRLSSGCRMKVAGHLILNITGLPSSCHYSFNHRKKKLITICCHKHGGCRKELPASSSAVYRMLIAIDVLAILLTLMSPLVALKVKLWLQFSSVIKFFRASLKTGITGQRNYVIRISERQLINLRDKAPFSLFRFLTRIIVHCQGEGRCCIHFWHEWYHQPAMCKRQSCCYKCCWPSIVRLVMVLSPVGFLTLLLYRIYGYPGLTIYSKALEASEGRIHLDMNRCIVFIYPSLRPYYSIWVGYCTVSFLYFLALLAWPLNGLEACLIGTDDDVIGEDTPKRSKTRRLYVDLTSAYREAWSRFHYGRDMHTSIFNISFGLKVGRLSRLLFDTLKIFPLISIMISLLNFDSRLYGVLKKPRDLGSHDQIVDTVTAPTICVKVLQVSITFMIWSGFLSLAVGAAYFIFITLQLLLNVTFFMVVATFSRSYYLQTYMILICGLLYYTNKELAKINCTMAYILKLIDEFSPRVSATCDQPEVPFSDRSVQILKAHNLGAVKFIDSDNSEFVSKELYYYVSKSLGYSWTFIARRLTTRIGVLVSYLLIVLFSIDALREIFISDGSVYTLFFATLFLIIVPEIACVACVANDNENDSDWTTRMGSILDENVRSDRDECCILDVERELTTYDVRPVGGTEYERPQIKTIGSLYVWRYSHSVSGERAAEREINVHYSSAIANKLSAAGFLVRVLKGDLPSIKDENTIANWTEMVEASVLEGAARCRDIVDPPIDSQNWFPPEIGAEVRSLNSGSTIDSLVDTLNAALYGHDRSTAALVTIKNFSFTVVWQNCDLILFTSALRNENICNSHGAMLLHGDFNTVALQEAIKLTLDPSHPEDVSVYNAVDTEVLLYTTIADTNNLEIV